jgi:hypothetical protein
VLNVMHNVHLGRYVHRRQCQRATNKPTRGSHWR